MFAFSMAKIFNPRSQKSLRQNLRNNLPPAEAILWTYLQGRKFHGLKFRRQHGIGPYIVDFYCPEMKLAVEVDGQSHFTPEQIEKDSIRTKFIESNGLQIVRVVNGDVYSDIEKVLKKIEKYLSNVENRSVLRPSGH